MHCCAVCRVLKSLQIVCVRFILIVYLTTLCLGQSTALEQSQKQTGLRAPWRPAAAPTGRSSRTATRWPCRVRGEALGVNLSAEFHAEIQTTNMPRPLCLHERREGPETRGCCSHFCPANNGPKPESIQSPRSCGFPTAAALSLKALHARTHTH